MESLVGTRYFCTMDLKSGFWQVKMSEESHQYTAFMVGSMGMYEFWEVLLLVDSEVAVRVSGVAETVDYFG